MGFFRGPNTVIDNSLVFYLDAANTKSYVSGSTTWGDLSGNNNTGTLTNGPTFSSANGGSIVFDGVNDFVDCGNQSSIQITGDISILSWINVTDFANFNGIVGKTTGNKPAPYDYYLYQTNGKPNLLRGNGIVNANYSGSNAPLLGVWQHIAVTMLGTQVTHYLNGSSNGVGTISTTIANGANNLIVGNRSDNGTDFKGNIAISQIYNRALSADEITQNYNAVKSRFNLT